MTKGTARLPTNLGQCEDAHPPHPSLFSPSIERITEKRPGKHCCSRAASTVRVFQNPRVEVPPGQAEILFRKQGAHSGCFDGCNNNGCIVSTIYGMVYFVSSQIAAHFHEILPQIQNRPRISPQTALASKNCPPRTDSIHGTTNRKCFPHHSIGGQPESVMNMQDSNIIPRTP